MTVSDEANTKPTDSTEMLSGGKKGQSRVVQVYDKSSIIFFCFVRHSKKVWEKQGTR